MCLLVSTTFTTPCGRPKPSGPSLTFNLKLFSASALASSGNRNTGSCLTHGLSTERMPVSGEPSFFVQQLQLQEQGLQSWRAQVVAPSCRKAKHPLALKCLQVTHGLKDKAWGRFIAHSSEFSWEQRVEGRGGWGLWWSEGGCLSKIRPSESQLFVIICGPVTVSQVLFCMVTFPHNRTSVLSCIWD